MTPSPWHPGVDVLNVLRGRPAGEIWLEFALREEVHDFDSLARLAGLHALGDSWVEVDLAHATWLLTSILHRDLAYGAVLIPEHKAERAAVDFLAAVGGSHARFATNQTDEPVGTPIAFTPATDHTFDCGIAVLGDVGAGIYWVADED